MMASLGTIIPCARKREVMAATQPPSRKTWRTALLLLAVAACLLTGMGRASGARAPAGPHRGGSIAVRFIFGLNCLDPLKNGNALFIVSAAYDTLLSYDEREHIRPGLALRWNFSHGGRWLTLYLRRDVRFSNGDRFDATTAKRVIALYIKPPAASSLAESLQKVTVLDRYTVRLIQRVPLRPVLDKLAGIPMIDPTSETQEGSNSCVHPPIGTGPFMLKSYTPGFSEITYVRNPRYHWGPPWLQNKGSAYLSTIVFKSIISDVTAASSLLSGDVDITRLPSTELNRVQGNADNTLHTFYENADLFLGFNPWHRPFDSAAVRRAFAEAIDRHALLEVVNGGYGKVAYSPIPPTVQFYDKNAKRDDPPYNPKDARRILASKHITGPFTLETYTIPAFATSAELIQAELAQVGVQINVITKDVPGASSDLNNGKFDLSVLIHRGNDLYPDYASPSPLNPVRNWLVKPNKTLNSLLIKSRETISPRKAMAVYAELQQYMDRNVIVDPLFSRKIILAARARVKGWHMTGTSDPLSYPAFQDLYVGK